jgi:hypothetical protein
VTGWLNMARDAMAKLEANRELLAELVELSRERV